MIIFIEIESSWDKKKSLMHMKKWCIRKCGWFMVVKVDEKVVLRDEKLRNEWFWRWNIIVSRWMFDEQSKWVQFSGRQVFECGLFNSWLESSSNHDNERKTTVLDTRGVDTISIITFYPTKPNTSKQRHQKKAPCRETRKIIPAFYALSHILSNTRFSVFFLFQLQAKFHTRKLQYTTKIIYLL